jgi:WD40 repeat protein
LPIALVIAGRAIGASASIPGNTPSGAVRSFVNRLQLSYARVIEQPADQYSAVWPMLAASLKVASKHKPVNLASCNLSLEIMYAALCVLQNQEWAPVSMLKHLWGLNEVLLAEEVVGLLSKYGLVAERIRNGQRWVMLFDLALKYCSSQAALLGGVAYWHRRLLLGYRQDSLSENGSGEGIAEAGIGSWWSEKLVDDGYLHANLARHFVGCGDGGVAELTTLLLDFRWTARQLAVNGDLRLRRDFALLRWVIAGNQESVNSSACGRDSAVDMSTSLGLISSAVQLAWRQAHKNLKELAFQTHGRLFARRSEMAWVERYVASVEMHAERPWLCSIDPFLMQPEGSLVVSPSVGFSVRSVILLPRCGHVLASGSEGSIVVVDTTAEIIVQEFQGHEGVVHSVAVSADGSRIASGGEDGTIRVWDTASGAAVGEPLRGHEGQVRSVALSADCSRVVSGGWDGTVRVWDVATGMTVGEPLRGHKECVYLVAASASGSRIVSSSFDNTARVWYVGDGAAVSEELRDGEGGVWSVLGNADGLRVFSSDDNGTVRAWNVSNGATESSPMRGRGDAVHTVAFSADGLRSELSDGEHTVRPDAIWDDASGAAEVVQLKGHTGRVRSLAVSADWSRVVSGGEDGTVRVWDAGSGTAVCNPLEGHHGAVHSVAATADGTRVVSGGDDGTVRVWDAVTGAPAAAPLLYDGVQVSSVAVSADGSRIFSGDYDGRVRMWDEVSGEAVGDPLDAHEGRVDAIAVRPDGAFLASYSELEWQARVWDMASGALVRTIAEGVPLNASSAELRAAAGFSAPSARATITVDYGAIWLTPQDGGSASRLGTLDACVEDRWVFDASRRVLWIGLATGGPVRIALIE